MKAVAIFISISILIISCTADGAWDLLRQQDEIFNILEDYDHRVKITIDNSAQDETFTDFPVLIVLNGSRITYSDISANGSGIKFISSDYTTELSYEVEEWNSGGESVFWVKIPSITALSNSDYFWIYYSKESNTDPTNSTDVWSNSYLAVWHMNDTDGTIKDSSSLGLDGIVDFMGGPGPVAGTIAGAQNFNNNAAKVTITPAAALDNAGPVTFSFWMLDNGYLDQDIILKKGGLEISLLKMLIPLHDVLSFKVDYDGATELEKTFLDIWIPAVWSSFYITWTGASGFNKVDIYEDGAELLDPDIKTNGNGNRVSDAGTDLIIGNNSLNAHSFLGQLDEIRISGIVRSPAWISAQYLSMTESFLTYSPEENVSN